MARGKIDPEELEQSALSVVDDAGLDALTLAIVAARLGVRPSALYTHVDGLDGLRQLVATASTSELAALIRNAAVGRSGDDAIFALGHAYRGFALDFPGRYASTLLTPTAAGGEFGRARADLADVFVRVIQGYGLDGPAAEAAAHTARSAIHGFVTLEHANPLANLDPASGFNHLLGTVARGLRDQAA